MSMSSFLDKQAEAASVAVVEVMASSLKSLSCTRGADVSRGPRCARVTSIHTTSSYATLIGSIHDGISLKAAAAHILTLVWCAVSCCYFTSLHSFFWLWDAMDSVIV